MFSRRTGWARQTNALTRATEIRRAARLPLIDLTASNPTHCEFRYDAPALFAPFADQRTLTGALSYDPDAFGLAQARAAVCRYYLDHNAPLAPHQVCLTTSTSEAYSFLFRLLCDPGDEILIAQPSYPLFDFLADLDNVRLTPYPLFYDHGWQIEPGALRTRITPRTRAIAVVHPNNPTGHYVSAEDREELDQVCAERGLVLIIDEVFLDYPLDPALHPRTFAQGPHRALTFVLSGLSKVAALPQMKASWIMTTGPDALAEEAISRLELVADTFLSMNAPVQYALPAWLADRSGMQQQISARTRANLAQLDAHLVLFPLATRLQVEAGWYAALRVPALGSDDQLALELVQRWGVLVHPGHYYGFQGDGWLVISLLPPARPFEQGLRSLLACLAERVK